MRKIIPLLLVPVFFLGACMGGVRLSRFDNPSLDTLKVQKVNLDEYQKKYPNSEAVFLEVHEVREHLGIPYQLDSYAKIRKLRYLVLNPDEEWLTTFNFEESGSTLNDAYALVISPDGTVKKFTKSDFKVEKNSNGRNTYKFAYPDVRKGTIIEESYEATGYMYSNLIQNTNTQFSVPAEHVKIQYVFPDNWTLQLKEPFPGKPVKIDRKDDDDNGKIILTYDRTDVPAVKDEPYSPYFKEIGSYIKLMVTDIGDRQSRVSSSWSEFSNRYKNYLLNRNSMWSNAVENTTEDITEGVKTDVEKLDTIVRYIQQNIKIGDSRADDKFSDVIKRGEGDAYMVTALAKAMLKSADIKSEFILIHNGRDGFFDRNYITDDELYFPAITTQIGSTIYVVFPWIKNLPIDVIPEYFQGQPALKINENGYVGFFDLPYLEGEDNATDENYNLTINDEGMITVNEEKIFRGTDAYSVRESLKDISKEEMDKLVKKMLTYTDGNVKVESYEILNQNDSKKPLTIKLKYKIDNLVTVTPDEVVFQTGGLFSPSSNTKIKVEKGERQNPVRIYTDEMYKKNITINYPATWTLSTALNPIQEQNQFGAIKGEYENSPARLVVRQSRLLKRSSEPKEKYQDVLTINGKKSKVYIPTLIFKVNG